MEKRRRWRRWVSHLDWVYARKKPSMSFELTTKSLFRRLSIYKKYYDSGTKCIKVSSQEEDSSPRSKAWKHFIHVRHENNQTLRFWNLKFTWQNTKYQQSKPRYACLYAARIDKRHFDASFWYLVAWMCTFITSNRLRTVSRDKKPYFDPNSAFIEQRDTTDVPFKKQLKLTIRGAKLSKL